MGLKLLHELLPFEAVSIQPYALGEMDRSFRTKTASCKNHRSSMSIRFSRIDFEGETCLLEECPRLLAKALQPSDPLAVIDDLVKRVRQDAERREEEERLFAQRSWIELVDEVKTTLCDIRAKRQATSAQKIRERVALRRRCSIEECAPADLVQQSSRKCGRRLENPSGIRPEVTVSRKSATSLKSALPRQFRKSKTITMSVGC